MSQAAKLILCSFNERSWKTAFYHVVDYRCILLAEFFSLWAVICFVETTSWQEWHIGVLSSLFSDPICDFEGCYDSKANLFFKMRDLSELFFSVIRKEINALHLLLNSQTHFKKGEGTEKTRANWFFCRCSVFGFDLFYGANFWRGKKWR